MRQGGWLEGAMQALTGANYQRREKQLQQGMDVGAAGAGLVRG